MTDHPLWQTFQDLRHQYPHCHFSVKGLALLLHCSQKEADSVTQEAMSAQIVRQYFQWICPQCSSIVATSVSPECPNPMAYCESCGEEFFDWPVSTWDDYRLVRYSFG